MEIVRVRFKEHLAALFNPGALRGWCESLLGRRLSVPSPAWAASMRPCEGEVAESQAQARMGPHP